ncbi:MULTISPECIES: hypothetical protein [Leptolyngbya]|uniref:hypothetical protein n=1 Tax=Leptolyngbya TaxID=47251 RepID=UPI001687CA88|nr:hypothetical protein [Leptolyngbya sp. FACHB-1624]MBD1859371.1 hypothetical protein [Leptolyngbya sp. FACHB-1624]
MSQEALDVCIKLLPISHQRFDLRSKFHREQRIFHLLGQEDAGAIAIYGVLKSGKPFSLDYGNQSAIVSALQ